MEGNREALPEGDGCLAIQECVQTRRTGAAEAISRTFAQRSDWGELCTLLPVKPTMTDHCRRKQSDDRDLP